MFWRWLENVRKKPKAIRQQYAFVMAVTITGTVGLLWSLSLPQRLGTVASSLSGAEQVATTPFSTIRKQFGELREVGSGIFQGVNDSTVTNNDESDTPTALQAVIERSLAGEESETSESTPEDSTKQPPVTILIGTSSATATNE